MECARDSIDQLSPCKTESERKDTTIAALRKELAEHKKTSWSKDHRYNIKTACNIVTRSTWPQHGLYINLPGWIEV